MPRIPGYEQGAMSLPQIPLSTGTAKGEGMVALGNAISQFGETMFDTFRYIEQKKGRVYANSSMAKIRAYVGQKFVEAKKNAAPGAEGFTPNILKDYDEVTKKFIDESPNQWGKADLSAAVEDFRATIGNEAISYEAAVSEAKTRFDVKNSSMMAADTLITSPQWFEQIRTDQLAALTAVSGSMTPQNELSDRFEMINSLAISAIQGEIRIDPKVALEKLKSGYWDQYEWAGQKWAQITPDQKDNLMQSASRAASTTNKLEQYTMRENVRNHIASIEETGVGMAAVNQDEVYQVFSNNGEDPDAGKIAVLEMQSGVRVARRLFAIKQGLLLATPDDRNKLISQYKPKPGSPTFADDQATYEKLIQWNAADQKLLQDDPSQWADKQGDVTEALNKGGPLAAAETSLFLQEVGGLPAYKRKVLETQDAKEIVASLNSMEPSDMLLRMASLDQEYGQRFGAVISELQDQGLSPQVATAYSIGKFNPSVGTDLMAALKVKDQDIKEQFNSSRGMPWSQVENQVALVFDGFMRSQARLAPGRVTTVAGIQSLFAKAAALKYAGDSSRDVGQVAQDMYDRSIGSMIDVFDTYYIPKQSVKGDPIDTKKRARELNRSVRQRDWLQRNNVVAPFPIDDIVQYGQWQTLADGSGVRLVIERPVGIFPVQRKTVRKNHTTYEDFTISFVEMAGSDRLGVLAEKDQVAEDVASTMRGLP